MFGCLNCLDIIMITLLHAFIKISSVTGISFSHNSPVSLLQGADPALRCRWTDMNAMHYAVYFDAAETVHILTEKNQALVMSTCAELSNGTCLHLAAANLSLEAGKVLVSAERNSSCSVACDFPSYLY